MSFRSTVFLALVFAALAAYLYFVELPRQGEDEGGDVLLAFDRASVTRVELEHPGRVVVVEREGDSWRMLEPVAAPADQRGVENLLDAVEQAEQKRVLEDAGELATYGLDAPSVTIRLSAGEDTLGVLQLGKQTPVGGSVYVRRADGAEVLLTDAGLATRLDQKAADLRDKTILAFDTEQVSAITFTGGATPTVRLQRGDDRRWRIVEPVEFDADRAAVSSLVSTLSSMRAVDFLDEEGADLGRYGLDAPRRTVTLELADGDPLELRIGNEREGKLRVQTNLRPTVYTVAAWVAESVDRDAGHFRNKVISTFALDDAVRLSITSPGDADLELTRAGESWQASGRDEAVEQDAVVEMLRELAALEAFEIAADLAEGGDLAPFGLAPPRRTIRVYGADDEPLAAVGIGWYGVDGARAEYTAIDAGATAPTVFLIRENVYQRLDRGAGELLDDEARSGGSEGAAAPVPDGEAGDGVDQHPLDDAAAAGE